MYSICPFHISKFRYLHAIGGAHLKTGMSVFLIKVGLDSIPVHDGDEFYKYNSSMCKQNLIGICTHISSNASFRFLT